MNNLFDSVKPAQKTHTLFAEVFDKTARMQLAIGEQLLDLNKKRFATLYAGKSATDILAAQQDLITEAGSRATTIADEFQKVATDFQSGMAEAVNGWVTVATEAVNEVTGATQPAKAKKVSRKAA